MRGFFNLMMLRAHLKAINMNRDGHYNLWSVVSVVVGRRTSRHGRVMQSRMLHVIHTMVAVSIVVVVGEGGHAGSTVVGSGHQLTALPLCSFVLKPDTAKSQYLISRKQTRASQMSWTSLLSQVAQVSGGVKWKRAPLRETSQT